MLTLAFLPTLFLLHLVLIRDTQSGMDAPVRDPSSNILLSGRFIESRRFKPFFTNPDLPLASLSPLGIYQCDTNKESEVAFPSACIVRWGGHQYQTQEDSGSAKAWKRTGVWHSCIHCSLKKLLWMTQLPLRLYILFWTQVFGPNFPHLKQPAVQLG